MKVSPQFVKLLIEVHVLQVETYSREFFRGFPPFSSWFGELEVFARLVVVEVSSARIESKFVRETILCFKHC